MKLALILTLLAAAGARAADSKPAEPKAAAAKADDGRMLLTIFLRHDESKTLDELNAHLDKTGFHQQFPPEGVEIVSWYVMMGIGQVVTVSLPPAKLRELNRMIEQKAWGAFHTEFYPTYDFKAVAAQQRATPSPAAK
ncbi:MAG TPA: hypothetical protein VH083_07490 [Myxococcales bacterium]|jgi:hypothetical protein|nr:hypothetical protein [Myxococcales bacterium]